MTAVPSVDESEYPQQPRGLRMAVSAPVLALLLATLDNLILSTAMPTLLAELGGLDKLSWVVTSYTLATAASTPIWGKLGDMYGRREVFLASLTLFMIGSLLAGISGSMVELITYRSVQGLGGGGLMVGAFSIIMDIMPPREGGKYQGAVASIMGVAMVGGPLAGGVITDYLGWRWSFFINLPLGILAVALALTMLRLPRRRGRGRVDYLGATLLAAVVSALVLALSWAGERYPWESGVIIGLGGFVVVGLVAFLFVERRVSEPVLPLGMFRSANFSVITSISFLLGTVVFVVMTFVPLFQQTVQGASATNSGLLLSPMLGAISVVNIISGRIIGKTGRYKILIVAGGGLLTLGLALLSQMGVGTNAVISGAFTAIYGAGMGLLMSTAMLVASESVARSDLGVASSTITLARTIGGAIGLAIAGTMFAGKVQSTMADQGAASAVGQTTQLSSNSLRNLPGWIRDAYQHAVSAGTHDVFILAAVTGAALFGLAWFIAERPLRGHKAPAPQQETVAAPIPQGRHAAAEPTRELAHAVAQPQAADASHAVPTNGQIAIPVTAAEETRPLVSMSLPTKVRGHVRRKDGRSVAGATLFLVDLQGHTVDGASTAADGRFEMRSLTQGQHVLIVSANACKPESSPVAVSGDLAYFDVVLAGAAVLVGVVTSSSNGAPIPRATIELSNDRGELVVEQLTGPDGQFAVSELYVGAYDLIVRAHAHRSAAARIILRGAAPATVRIELASQAGLRGIAQADNIRHPDSNGRMRHLPAHRARDWFDAARSNSGVVSGDVGISREMNDTEQLPDPRAARDGEPRL